ncbi:shikimate dehydrogenase [Sinorhizobium fredii]
MRDSRETFVNHAFVTGYPIKHSRSPLIHGYWLQQFAIAGSYRAHEVAPEAFPDFMRQLRDGRAGFCGGNVTIPHKEMAFELSDRPDDLSAELGAANTLWLEDGRICAANTDGRGFVANLDERASGWDRISTAVILGAGGASRAVIQAVRDRGVKTIHVVNRTAARAQELADRFGRAVHAHPIAALSRSHGRCRSVREHDLAWDGRRAGAADRFLPLGERGGGDRHRLCAAEDATPSPG